MGLTQTILDDPDISKPSSSGSSDTLMIVSLPTPPYRTGVRQKLLHWMPHNTSIASDAPKRKNTYPVGSMRADGSSRALRSDATGAGVGVAHMPHAALQASMAVRLSAPSASHRENFSATQGKFQKGSRRESPCAARSFRDVLSDNNTAASSARGAHRKQ